MSTLCCKYTQTGSHILARVFFVWLLLLLFQSKLGVGPVHHPGWSCGYISWLSIKLCFKHTSVKLDVLIIVLSPLQMIFIQWELFARCGNTRSPICLPVQLSCAGFNTHPSILPAHFSFLPRLQMFYPAVTPQLPQSVSYKSSLVHPSPPSHRLSKLNVWSQSDPSKLSHLHSHPESLSKMHLFSRLVSQWMHITEHMWCRLSLW